MGLVRGSVPAGMLVLVFCCCWRQIPAAGVGKPAKNQQNTSKSCIFYFFFRKNIFKLLFFIKYLLLSHLGTKQNFYFDVLLVPVGTEKKPFLIGNGKNSKFSIFLGPIFPNN
jgi:hypothetical protein